jgi:hypothetical protein
MISLFKIGATGPFSYQKSTIARLKLVVLCFILPLFILIPTLKRCGAGVFCSRPTTNSSHPVKGDYCHTKPKITSLQYDLTNCNSGLIFLVFNHSKKIGKAYSPEDTTINSIALSFLVFFTTHQYPDFYFIGVKVKISNSPLISSWFNTTCIA